MNYIITNIITQETFDFEFQRSKSSLRAFIVNSASGRSDIELFRNVSQYGIGNFKIESQGEAELPKTDNLEVIEKVEYEKLVKGKPEPKPTVFIEKKEKKERKKRTKKNVT